MGQISAWKSASVLDTFERDAAIDRTPRCASCGKEPPYLDFSMCVRCRVKAGLPVSEDALREALAKASDEARRRKEAHERFNQRHKEDAGMAKPWTSEEDAILRENAHKGCREVAQMLGRTERSVSQHAKKVKVSFIQARAKAGVSGKKPCAHCGGFYTEGAGLSMHERGCKENPANKPIAPKPAATTSADLLDSAALKSLPYPEQPEAVVVHPEQATPEERAGHRDHVEEYDPAGTVPSKEPERVEPYTDVTLRDIVASGGDVRLNLMEDELLDINAEQSATIEVLIERIASLESYRELPLHLRLREVLHPASRPYQSLSHVAIEAWAVDKATRRRYAQATDKLTRLLRKLSPAEVAEVLSDVERRIA